ncbi:hypothetical protein [Spiroplasma endosymbiont of Cantharis rufa]|uniref:hypothetical protein n=1 Tax=Spiroplasma endosymbiont of Cantharis rufa TaxID=3066279 RepID=UPI0030CAA141
MNNNLDILENDIKNNKLNKRFKNNLVKVKSYLLYKIIFLILYFVFIIAGIYIIFISKIEFLQILIIFIEIVSIIVLIGFASFISKIFFIFNKRKLEKHSSKLKKINWVKLHSFYNKDFKIAYINLNKFYIEDNILKQLLIDRTIKSIEINNTLSLMLKDKQFFIDYLNLSINEENTYLQLTQRICIKKIVKITETQNIIKKLSNPEKTDSKNCKDTEIVNIINICKIQELITFTKDFKHQFLSTDNIDLSKYIFGLYGQKNYNSYNCVKHFENIVRDDIGIIENLISKFLIKI